MLNNSRTDTVAVGGKWREYRDNGSIIESDITNVRNYIYDFNVYEQRLGIPNAPVINPLRWQRSESSYFRGSNRYFDTNWKLRYEALDHHAIDGLRPSTAPFAYDWDDMEGDAYSRFLGKVRDERANLAVDLAEGKQTYKMVASAMDTVASYARKLPVAPLAVLSNAWLAYKYGWSPAIQTIYGVAQYAKTNLLQREITSSYTQVTNHGGSSYPHAGYNIKVVSGQTSRTIRYGARLVLRNPLMYDLQRLTSLNPAVIAWELVPFSFVVDWFYDIGSFLSDAETVLSMGHNLRYGYKTYYSKVELSHRLEATTFGYQMPPSGSMQAYRVISANADSSFKTYNRQPISSFNLPYAPTLQADLGASRVISGAALLYQLFHTRKR